MKSNHPQNQQNYRLPDKVYYVSCDNDPTVLVAMDVQISDSMIRWFDTLKERLIDFEALLDTDPDNFVFRRRGGQGGGIYTLVPMNLSIYNSHVKARLVSAKNYSSEETMIAAFIETKKSAW
jgi:hypothetical protein